MNSYLEFEFHTEHSTGIEWSFEGQKEKKRKEKMR